MTAGEGQRAHKLPSIDTIPAPDRHQHRLVGAAQSAVVHDHHPATGDLAGEADPAVVDSQHGLANPAR